MFALRCRLEIDMPTSRSSRVRRLPLAGALVAVTRPEESARTLVAALERAGAEPLLAPAIRRAPPKSYRALDTGIAGLIGGTFDGVLFTSPASVPVFVGRLLKQGDATALRGKLLAAVGEGTAAALRARDIRPHVVAHSGGEELAEAIVARYGENIRGARFLLPRAAGGREELRDGLEAAGATVKVADAYRIEPAQKADLLPLAEALDEGDVAAVLFASPSAVDAVVKALGRSAPRLLGGTRLVAIGRTTGKAIEERGLEVAAVAAEPSDAGLVAATIRALEAAEAGGPSSRA
jgi:uroporphyrinogen-III synthase